MDYGQETGQESVYLALAGKRRTRERPIPRGVVQLQQKSPLRQRTNLYGLTGYQRQAGTRPHHGLF